MWWDSGGLSGALEVWLVGNGLGEALEVRLVGSGSGRMMGYASVALRDDCGPLLADLRDIHQVDPQV